MTSDVIAIVAYIDPGMGSLLMQMLLAGIVGMALFFRTQWLSCVSWIKRKTIEQED